MEYMILTRETGNPLLWWESLPLPRLAQWVGTWNRYVAIERERAERARLQAKKY